MLQAGKLLFSICKDKQLVVLLTIFHLWVRVRVMDRNTSAISTLFSIRADRK